MPILPRLCLDSSPLLLDDLGVFDHGDAAALSHLTFERNGFTAVFGKLIVHRLVFANDEVRFTVAHDSGGAARFNALRPA